VPRYASVVSDDGLCKADPIFLDISPASGGMNPNQGGRDESEAPKEFVWEQ
jgi:hypothetical protein